MPTTCPARAASEVSADRQLRSTRGAISGHREQLRARLAHIHERGAAIACDLRGSEVPEIGRYGSGAQIAHHPAEDLRQLEIRKWRQCGTRYLHQVAAAGGALG